MIRGGENDETFNKTNNKTDNSWNPNVTLNSSFGANSDNVVNSSFVKKKPSALKKVSTKKKNQIDVIKRQITQKK